MSENKKPYCGACGEKKVSVKSGSFDQNTGQPLFELVCLNFGCYCNRICRHGHDFRWFRSSCKSCGLPDFTC